MKIDIWKVDNGYYLKWTKPSERDYSSVSYGFNMPKEKLEGAEIFSAEELDSLARRVEELLK